METINEDVFNFVKPGETLNDRIETCQGVSDAGIELSSGLLVGLGESLEDRIAHLRYLNNFETLGEIPIMGFNPYKDTPMANHPPSPLEEQLKIMAVTRIMYPEKSSTVKLKIYCRNENTMKFRKNTKTGFLSRRFDAFRIMIP